MIEHKQAEGPSGTSFGRYQVVEHIGSGGMGAVYAAYDEKLQRKVALKSIRLERQLDEQARNRFLREARVLSQLGHPNICQIFDYLEGKEGDFLVLELIDGRNLSKAIRKGLPDGLKLRIAEQIASVLVAAHGKGVIHRDLKPDNVMLTQEDQVKVLDFGLSRQLGEEPALTPRSPSSEAISARTGSDQGPNVAEAVTEIEPAVPDSGSDSGLTTAGSILGTLGYMSPEQARGEPVTPASDMYSFGLLLQELFTEKAPVETESDVETRVERSRAREASPVSVLDPDLQALINRLKSLAPGARPSAEDTVQKLTWIREKPLRRRKKILLSVAATALMVFSLAMAVQSIRAGRAEKRAREEAEMAKQVSDFLTSIFNVSDPGETRGKTVTAREILDKGAKKVATELKGQPLVQARLMSTMGTVYTELGLYNDAEPLLSFALGVQEKALGPNHPDVAESLNNLASLHWFEGKYAEAESLYKRSLEIWEKTLGPDHPDVAKSLNNLALVYWNEGKYAEAVPLAKRSLDIWEKALGPEHPDVARSLNGLASIYSSQGQKEKAEPLFQRSAAIYEKALGSYYPGLAAPLVNLANLYCDEGRLTEAEPLYTRSLAIREKTLGQDHPDVAVSLNNLATLYCEEGKYAEAEPLCKRSLAIYEKALGPDHSHLADALNTLATVYWEEGKYAEAEPLYKRSLAIREKTLGPDHPDVAGGLNDLANLYRDDSRYAEAVPLYTRALAIYEKAMGSGSRESASVLLALASCEFKERRFGDALDHSIHCLTIGRELVAKMPKDQEVRFLTGSALLLKGRIDAAMGKGAEGKMSLQEAYSILQPIAHDAQNVNEQASYSQTLLCLGRTEEARPIVKKLLDSGYRNPDLLALCRENGLVAEESPPK